MTPPMPPARRNTVTTIPNKPWPPLGQLIPRIIDVKYQIPCVNGLTWRGLELQSPAAARRILGPIYSRFPFFGKGYISECTDKVCYNCFLRSWYFLIDSILIALSVRSVLCLCVHKLCIYGMIFFSKVPFTIDFFMSTIRYIWIVVKKLEKKVFWPI